MGFMLFDNFVECGRRGTPRIFQNFFYMRFLVGLDNLTVLVFKNAAGIVIVLIDWGRYTGIVSIIIIA